MADTAKPKRDKGDTLYSQSWAGTPDPVMTLTVRRILRRPMPKP